MLICVVVLITVMLICVVVHVIGLRRVLSLAEQRTIRAGAADARTELFAGRDLLKAKGALSHEARS